MRIVSIRPARLLACVALLSAFASATHCVPTTPLNLTQLNGDSSPLSTGGTTSGGTPTSVIVRGTAEVSCDQGQSLRLEFEVIPTSSSFTGTPTHLGNTTIPTGTSSATATGLTAGTAYKWQVRVNDLTNGFLGSYTSFNGGATAFTVAGGAPPSGMPGISGTGRIAMIVGLAGMLLVLAGKRSA